MTTSRIARDTEQDTGPAATSFADMHSAAPSTKSALRQLLLTRRRAMSAAEKTAAETVICSRLLAWWHAHPVTCLGVYFPIGREPDLLAAYHALRALGVRLCLPVIRGKDQPLDFIGWAADDTLIKEAHGTSVPTHGNAVAPDALLIPCLGFNSACFRLGYGGGYYDRTLAQPSRGVPHPRPIAVGIAFADAQATFTAEAHDVALDVVITDR